MLKLEGISKSYGKDDTKAVDNLSFELKQGEVCALLGPNGAGKTTTLKMILGFLKPDKGKITIGEFDLDKDNIGYKMCIGYVSDNHDIYDSLTGKEYLDFIADSYEVSELHRKERIEQLLEAFQLKACINDPIKSYSHGMKQKISIIASLVHEPLLWVLDEPLTGLDVESAHLLKQLIKNHAKSGKTVLFSTHILEVCEKLCDKIIIINKGRCLLEKDIRDMDELKNSSLEEIFLGIVKHE